MEYIIIVIIIAVIIMIYFYKENMHNMEYCGFFPHIAKYSHILSETKLINASYPSIPVDVSNKIDKIVWKLFNNMYELKKNKKSYRNLEDDILTIGSLLEPYVKGDKYDFIRLIHEFNDQILISDEYPDYNKILELTKRINSHLISMMH